MSSTCEADAWMWKTSSPRAKTDSFIEALNCFAVENEHPKIGQNFEKTKVKCLNHIED